MNRLRGDIVQIETSGQLSIVSVAVSKALVLKAIVVETPTTAPYLKQGNTIAVLFKETEVIIGAGAVAAISLQNKISCTIAKIDTGTLLSKLVLKTYEETEISAIISSKAVNQLNLTVDSKVQAMIKLNEMMLAEL